MEYGLPFLDRNGCVYNKLLVSTVVKALDVDTEVQCSSPHQSTEEFSRSPFNHCFTLPRCNGYLAFGDLSDDVGLSSSGPVVNPIFKAEYSLGR